MAKAAVAENEVATEPEAESEIPTYTVTEGATRSQQARELAKQGMSRTQISKAIGLSYAGVYAATAGIDVPGAGRHPGTTVSGAVGDVVRGSRSVMIDGRPRADIIREKFLNGQSRGEICKELQVSYPTVWAATSRIKNSVSEANADEETELHVEDEDENGEELEGERDTTLIP